MIKIPNSCVQICYPVITFKDDTMDAVSNEDDLTIQGRGYLRSGYFIGLRIIDSKGYQFNVTSTEIDREAKIPLLRMIFHFKKLYKVTLYYDEPVKIDIDTLRADIIESLKDEEGTSPQEKLDVPVLERKKTFKDLIEYFVEPAEVPDQEIPDLSGSTKRSQGHVRQSKSVAKIHYPVITFRKGRSPLFPVESEEALTIQTPKFVDGGFFDDLRIIDSKGNEFIVMNTTIDREAKIPFRLKREMLSRLVKVELEYSEPEQIALDQFKADIINAVRYDTDYWRNHRDPEELEIDLEGRRTHEEVISRFI